MTLKIIASILTGIGGHYLNRRWDKAILFLCLFVICLVSVYASFYLSFQKISNSPGDFIQNFYNTVKLFSKISLIGIVCLWFVSLAITILDSKNNIESNIVKWTKAGIFGASFTSFLSILTLVFPIILILSFSQDQNIQTVTTSYDSDSPGVHSHNFYEHIYLGGSPSNSHNLPDPPKGEGILKGKISYKNEPATNVHLDLILNSKYSAKDIVTDKDGIFTVNLTPGSWKINSIQTKSWEDKPEAGNYTMYYGGESKINGGKYDRHADFRKTGFPVEVSTDSNTPHINLTIHDDIKLFWPNSEIEGITASINDTIKWGKYPGAAKYYIEIEKIRRENTTTHYEPVTSRVLSTETSIALLSLKHRKIAGTEKTEYAARIYGFSEDGTLIAQCSDIYRGGTFLLSDGNILIEDDLDDIFALSSIEDPEELEAKIETISLNQRRATAVSVLIDDKMISEARSVLNLIDSEYSKGEKEALTGYILALQGECDKSNAMFDKARSINPDVCISDEYKANCK